jgi:hypothetical protein
MGEYRDYTINLSCACKCSKLEISQYFEDNKPQEVTFIQYVSTHNMYYRHIWPNIKNKFKLIWYILSGQQYCVFDLVLQNKEEIKAFKEAVAKLDESVDYRS